MPTPRAERPLQAVLWGATGFTGRLVAEYLARQHRGVRWAIGGRSQAKLEALRSELVAIDGALAELPIRVADAGSAASLMPLVSDARVVISTVGPYARYGAELVAACVEHGTDYADLTGEPQFIRQTIDRHHLRARETGARIVHCCGYDSIPSDLGTLFLQSEMKARHGVTCNEVRAYAAEVKGGFSGGTAASAMLMAEQAAADPAVRRVLGNPYSLDPDRPSRGPDGRDALGVHRDEALGTWTGPFVMASINAKVVRRTNALLGYPWGLNFRYSEGMSTGSGLRGLGTAMAISAGTIALGVGSAIGPLRRLIQAKVLPAPGEGPPVEVREKGRFTHRLVGLGRQGPELVATVRGYHDPGYGETSRMIAESALCLSSGEAIRQEGGVLTPASALGLPLLERLRRAGMTFDIEAAPAR